MCLTDLIRKVYLLSCPKCSLKTNLPAGGLTDTNRCPINLIFFNFILVLDLPTTKFAIFTYFSFAFIFIYKPENFPGSHMCLPIVRFSWFCFNFILYSLPIFLQYHKKLLFYMSECQKWKVHVSKFLYYDRGVSSPSLIRDRRKSSFDKGSKKVFFEIYENYVYIFIRNFWQKPFLCLSTSASSSNKSTSSNRANRRKLDVSTARSKLVLLLRFILTLKSRFCKIISLVRKKVLLHCR